MGPHGINWDLDWTCEPKSVIAAVWCKDSKDKPCSAPVTFQDFISKLSLAHFQLGTLLVREKEKTAGYFVGSVFIQKRDVVFLLSNHLLKKQKERKITCQHPNVSNPPTHKHLETAQQKNLKTVLAWSCKIAIEQWKVQNAFVFTKELITVLPFISVKRNCVALPLFIIIDDINFSSSLIYPEHQTSWTQVMQT